MKKITDLSKARKNLLAERKYEKTNRRNRNTETAVRMQAKRDTEKKLWRKLKSTESVDHIKPLSKGWTNNKSNLRVISRKKNFALWAKLKAKSTQK